MQPTALSVVVGHHRVRMSYTIDTNLAPDRVPDDFLSGVSDFLCRLFDRPKRVIMGQLRAGQTFHFSGTADPCAVMNVTRGTLGAAADGDAVGRYVAAISEHLRDALGVPESRIMIFYHEHDMALMGNNGRTLKSIWSEIGKFPTT